MGGVARAADSTTVVPASGVPTAMTSGVELSSGEDLHGTIIYPIDGYTREQCVLTVSGRPYKASTDSAYKRSRHFSHSYEVTGSGWVLRAEKRHITDNAITPIPEAVIQWSMICSK